MKKYTKQTTKPTTTHSGEGKISIAAHNFHSPSSYSFTCMNQDNTWLKSHKIPQDLQNSLRVTTQLNPILQSYCSNSHLHVKCALELFPVAEEKPSIQQRYWANKSVQSPRAECPWASPRGQILLTGAVTSQLRLILHQTPLAHMEPSWLTGPKIYTPAWGAELSDCHTGHRGHALLLERRVCNQVPAHLFPFCVDMLQKITGGGRKTASPGTWCRRTESVPWGNNFHQGPVPSRYC